MNGAISRSSLPSGSSKNSRAGTEYVHADTTAREIGLFLFSLPARNGGTNKFGEERMRGERACLELGVELRTEHEGVLRTRQFGDFHEYAVRRGTRENETSFF